MLFSFSVGQTWDIWLWGDSMRKHIQQTHIKPGTYGYEVTPWGNISHKHRSNLGHNAMRWFPEETYPTNTYQTWDIWLWGDSMRKHIPQTQIKPGTYRYEVISWGNISNKHRSNLGNMAMGWLPEKTYRTNTGTDQFQTHNLEVCGAVF